MIDQGRWTHGVDPTQKIRAASPCFAQMPAERVVERLDAIPPELYAVTAVGAVLRLFRLGDESLWNDEFASMEDALAFGPQMAVEQLTVARPLYYIVLRPWIELFGQSEVAMRSLSVVIGVAAIPLLYYLGRELYGEDAAFLSALLLAFSRFHIRWSQDVRMYGLLALLAIASYLGFVRYLRYGSDGSRTAYVAATALLAYTHLYAAFVIVAQNLYVGVSAVVDGWRRPTRGLRDWVTAQGIVALLASPVIVAVMAALLGVGGRSGTGPQWIPLPPGVFTPITVVAQHIYKVFDPVVALLAFVAVLVLVAADLVLGTEERDTDGMLLIWFGSVLVIPLVLSHVLRPMLQLRYTIAGAPALLLLVGKSLATAYARIDERFVRSMFVLGLVLVLTLPLLPYYGEDQREQWREAGTYVEDHGAADDVVLVSEDYTARNFRYYFDGGAPVRGIDPGVNRSRIRAETAGHERVWLVISNVEAGPRERLVQRFASVAEPAGDGGPVEQRESPGAQAQVRSFHRVAVYRFDGLSGGDER